MPLLRLLLITLITVALTACSQVRPEAPQSTDRATTESPVAAGPAWDNFVERYISEFHQAHPVFAVGQGKHEFDGQLPDWSKAGIDAEIARLKSMREKAMDFTDERLDELRQYQRDYLIARTNQLLFWLDTADWPYRNPAFYFDWLTDSLDPSPYVTLTYAPADVRIQAITRYLNNIPRAASQIRANLRTPLPETYVEYGIASFGGLADYYNAELVDAFSSVEDEALQQAFNEARKPAAEAMDGLRTWLQGERENATDDFALGADLYARMLMQTEMVDVSLDELEAIGRADLDRNTQALKTACKEYAPGEDIRTCFAKMANNKPQQGPVQAARDQLAGLKQFVADNDIVSIPSDEEARVEESPPYARSNFAYINIPGPYEKGQPSTYYISPPNPEWSEEVQAAYIPAEANLLFVSVHEVWPGHFLNFLHAKQSDFIFGRQFVGYAFAEGWAHYTEEMMWEAGLKAGDHETHIGQLSNALLRNIRYLCAIGMHARGMTVDECQAMFENEGFQDEGTARQQAARGTYDPAYLNYTMGKLMIRQLREDWTADKGGQQAWKAFHDEFLSYGGPPIPLVRAQMMGGEAEAVFPRK